MAKKLKLKKTDDERTAVRAFAILRAPVMTAQAAIEQLNELATTRGGKDALLVELGSDATQVTELAALCSQFVGDASDLTPNEF